MYVVNDPKLNHSTRVPGTVIYRPPERSCQIQLKLDIFSFGHLISPLHQHTSNALWPPSMQSMMIILSLVSRPRPAFRHLQQWKAGRGLGTRLDKTMTSGIMWIKQCLHIIPRIHLIANDSVCILEQLNPVTATQIWFYSVITRTVMIHKC